MNMEVFNFTELSSQQVAAIEAEVSNHYTLADVMTWGLTPGSGALLSRVIGDVIVQDEFSHDVIVPWRDNVVLVYSTT
ncbi:MAG TPA: hypothetical protein VJX67_07375 [Blastocatellia bacterium]|nr:hypothetical protein [Blastocatellia bacterium]